MLLRLPLPVRRLRTNATPHGPVDRTLPLAVALVTIVVYATVSIRLHDNLVTGMDLAIFDQAVRALSHFHAPVSAMKTPGMNLWGDHLHLVLVLVAPSYWLWDDPRMLLVVQAVAIGLASGLLTRSALRLLDGRLRRPSAVVLGLSLAVAPGVQNGALFDFHEVCLGMPLLAMALDALLRHRWRAFAAWALALLLVKEDAGILVVGLAAVAFLWGARRLGAVLAAVAVAWVALAIRVVIPDLSPAGRWAYASAVPGAPAAWTSVQQALLSPGALTVTLTLMVVATALLALRSPVLLAILPCLASRAISGNPSYWGLAFHYNLLPSVVVGYAALDGLRRVRPTRGWVAALAVAVGLGIVVGPLRDRSHVTTSPARLSCAHQAVATVPAGEPVAADVFLVTHLTHDHLVTQQVRPGGDGDRRAYLDGMGRPLAARYVVMDHATVSQGGAAGWVPQALDNLHAQGFRTVQRCGDFEVLRR